MSIFRRKYKFHFIGIGGVGMSGIAEILLEQGHRVSGSDREKNDLTDYLESKGARIFEGHRAENVQDVDFLVYSSAIPKNNPEMQAARQANIPMIRRAEMLGQLINRKLGIAVAGTHGKTTTTSMIGHILLEAETDPTIIVGGKLRNLMTNARLGSGDIVVTEADEYDRSFLTLFPRIAVITSLEADHLDIYKDLDDLKTTFTEFAGHVPFDGSIIACIDDENVRTVAEKIAGHKIYYGLSGPADLRAENLKFSEANAIFDVFAGGKYVDSFSLPLPGAHNVLNALAAIAVCRELDVPLVQVRKALAGFRGVARRFEIFGRTERDIMVVDDYAHHPSEVEATLRSARNGWIRRLVAVFQPHLFSRTRDFYEAFAESLSFADVVVVAGIYPAREAPIVGVSGKMIVDALKANNFDDAYYVENKDEIPSFLSTIVKNGDMIITLGAGNIWQVAKTITGEGYAL